MGTLEHTVCLVPCSQQNLEMERKLKSQVPLEGVGVAGGMDEVHIHCSVSVLQYLIRN